MQFKMRFFLSMSLLVTILGPVHALEVSLAGAAAGTGGGGGGRIGFVDMERIFQIYPQTKDAKDDYAKQLEKKRQQLSDKEVELENIKGRILVLESTLKDMGEVPASTGTETTPAKDSQSLAEMKTSLEQKKAEYEDMRKQAADDLAAFESQQSQIIFGKLYQALKELAQEEQVTLVVDKSNILYGTPDVDLTEKLQTRVRGY